MAEPRIVLCPKCGAAVRWEPESRYRPFCSARCKGVDLGAWASDEYRIPAETPPELPDGLPDPYIK